MKWLKRLFADETDWYPHAAVVIGIITLWQAVSVNRWTIAGWPRPLVLAAIFGLIFAVCRFAKVSGARWWGVPWLVLLVLGHIINASLGRWSASGIIGVVVMASMLAHFVFLYFFDVGAGASASEDPNTEGTGEDDKPFLSLVLLFRESPYLDAAVLASLASKAWGIPVTASGEEESSEDNDAAFIVGDAPIFMAKHPAAFCIIHHHDRPYFDNPEEVSAELTELRAASAVAEHRAWTAVDVLQWLEDSPDPDAAAYRLVARLLAELADDNVLAVFDPAASQIFVYDPETEQKLRSDNPLAGLRDQYYAPVIRVPDDDPAMLAAVAEARSRWPEFVAAFENRSPDADRPFTIKAPIGPEGSEEFIWIEVTSIEADVIYGTLGNQPAALPNLNLGDRVRVSASKVNDWLCLIDDKPHGGFTLKVIADYARGGGEEDSD